MIRVISGYLRQEHRDEIAEMHRIRARVFSDRLGWDVQVRGGQEIDEFDHADPTYLLAYDDVSGRLTGSSRLLPTTGPTMLRDVFSVLLPNEDVRSATIWESSRFALDTEDRVRAGTLSRATIELLCGMVELGLQVGLTQIVSVYDARMVRIFRAADCPAEQIGVPCRIGKVMAYAALFDVSMTMWERLARVGGISAPVIASIDGIAQRADHAA